MHRQQQPGLLRDVLQIAHQIGAGGTCFKMGLLVGISPAFDDVRQHFLKLLAIHSVHPLRTCSPATHRREAFSALLSFNRSRSFMRALCNCDLLLPMEHPIISAISLCSYPSMSCNTNMILYPGGKLSIHRSKFTRSMEPASTLSRAPMSFLGPSACCGSITSSSETSERP